MRIPEGILRFLKDVSFLLFLYIPPLGGPAKPPPPDQTHYIPMSGILYDLHQTHDRQRITADKDFLEIAGEFLNKDWDEEVLNRYYHVAIQKAPTQIFYQNMDSGDAPKFFGLENSVEGGLWMAHFKAQISPPDSGTYRFVGVGDNIMVVAIDDKIVLEGNLYRDIIPTKPEIAWDDPKPDGAQAGHFGHLRTGDWIDLRKSKIYDFDLLIGDSGYAFSAFLMIEKKGAHYPVIDGQNVLPIFQLAPYDTPQAHDLNLEPEFAKGYQVWKSVQ